MHHHPLRIASMSCSSFHVCWLFLECLLSLGVKAFTISAATRCSMHISHQPCTSTETASWKPQLHFLAGLVGGASALALPLAAIADPPLEKFGGQICIQRNLNGSCSKFAADAKDGTDEMPQVVKKSVFAEEPESELMKELKRRSLQNKGRNDEEIATKTFANGQAGEFGPFSRHKDTGQYELLDAIQLDDMKKAGRVTKERGTFVFVPDDQ